MSILPVGAPEALRKVRLAGYACTCAFTLTALLVLDGLQALVRDDFNNVDLPMGGQVYMSGAMPLKAKEHTEIRFDIEGVEGLSFTPITDFKGFWMGAHMWRATLDASNVTEPGKAVLTIVDLVPAKSTTTDATITVQNPSQIYTITVWPSAEAMQAAHLSFSRRVTGLPAFLTAALCLACGIAISVVNMLLFQAAQRILAQAGLFTIYGMKKTDAGHQVTFSQCDRKDVRAGQPISLLTPEGVEQGWGVLHSCAPYKCIALFPLDGTPPLYGWLLRYTPDTQPASEREEKISV